MDGGPGLSGLVVQTNTSLGLLLPSMFDAMSCGRGEGGGGEGGQHPGEGSFCEGEKWRTDGV